MPSHGNSTQYSQHLCDTLFGALHDALADAETHKSTNWCSYSIGASSRFCFIQHNAAKIRIFVRANEADRPQLKALLPTPRTIEIVRRKAMTSEWAAITAYFVDIAKEEQIAEIVPALVCAADKSVERSSARQAVNGPWISPSAIPSSLGQTPVWEGVRIGVLVNRYERNRRARNACIKRYGAVCFVCI
jgi:hypothetical protein